METNILEKMKQDNSENVKSLIGFTSQLSLNESLWEIVKRIDARKEKQQGG